MDRDAAIRRHLRRARTAFRTCDAPAAARHFRTAAQLIPPGGPGREPALWGLIDALQWNWAYGEAADACERLDRPGHHPFYRKKAHRFGSVYRDLDDLGYAQPEGDMLDPVEAYTMDHLGADRHLGWVTPAWNVFLWSVDAAPAGLDAVEPWAAALLTLHDVLEGGPPPEVPTAHFRRLWTALFPDGETGWLDRYSDGRKGLEREAGGGPQPDA